MASGEEASGSSSQAEATVSKVSSDLYLSSGSELESDGTGSSSVQPPTAKRQKKRVSGTGKFKMSWKLQAWWDE